MKYGFIISGEIGVEFNWWTGQKGTTAAAVRSYLNAHKDEEVHIAVASPGGYVSAGLEIYQMIKEHGNVSIHIMGMSASAATFLTMGARHVDMVKGSLMLIHNASTQVSEWQSANKEQLDALIEKYKKQREDLDTIDKVIASLYAERSGKSVDDCMKKMQRAAWLSPEDALEFGLIDEIAGEQPDGMRNTCPQTFMNSYLKEYGLPPLPTAVTEVATADNGGPTKSLFQKTVEAVKGVFRNEPAQKNIQMIKIFNRVMDLLSVTDGFAADDSGDVKLSQEQMKKIDDRLGELQDTADKAVKAKEELQKKLDEANDKVKALQEQVENLKNAPGDDSKAEVEDTTDDESGEKNFLDEARKAFNRVKDI